MGFFSNILGAVFQVATLPVRAVDDVANALEGEEIGSTADGITSAIDNTAGAAKDLVHLRFFDDDCEWWDC